MKRSLKLLMSALTVLVLPAFGWAANPTPVYLLDAGSTATVGWVQVNKNGSYPAFLETDTTNGTVYMTSTSAGNFFNGYGVPTKGFADGTYVGLNGTEYTSVLAEMAATLGLTSVPNTILDNMVNGGYAGQTVTVFGLDTSKTYVMYYIGGATKDNQAVAGFALKSGTYAGSPVVEYVCTSGGQNTSTVTSYTAASSATVAMRAAKDGYLLVRVSYIKPAAAGTIQFTLSGERSNICALAIAEIDPLPDAITHTRTIDGTESWSTASEWTNSTLPANVDVVNLTADVDGATLDIDTAARIDQLTIGGNYALTVTGSETLTANMTAINTDTDVSAIKANLGAVTIEKDVTLTGLAPNTTVSSLAGEGTYVLGTADAGTEYAPSWAADSTTPITWTQGKLTFAAGNDGTGYPKSAPVTVTGANAQMVLKTNTDTTGYRGGTASLTIADGAKLVVEARDTFNRQLILDNASVTFSADDLDSGRAFDLFSNSSITSRGTSTIGGASAEKDDVYGNETVKSGIIAIRRSNFTFDVTDTLSVYSAIGSADGDGGTTTKTGSGTLELYRAATSGLPVAVNEGTLALINAGTLTTTGAYTIAQDATLAVSISTGTKTMTNTFNGPGTIAKQGTGTLDLSGATFGETAPAIEIEGGILVVPAGKEGTITVPAGATLKLMIADNVDTYTASGVTLTDTGALVFVDSTGAEILEGVVGKTYTRPAVSGDAIANEADLIAAVATAGEYTLDSSVGQITLTDTLVINVGAGNEVTLDLNGCTIAHNTAAAIRIESGTLNLINTAAETAPMIASYGNYAVVIGEDADGKTVGAACELTIGETVSLYAAYAAKVTVGTIGGSGTLFGSLALSAGTTIDATAGALELSGGDLMLPPAGTVNITVLEEDPAGTVVLNASLESLDATKFVVSNNKMGVGLGSDENAGKIVLAAFVCSDGSTAYTSIQAAINAVAAQSEDVTIMLSADSDETLTLPETCKTLTLASFGSTFTGKVYDIYGTELQAVDGVYSTPTYTVSATVGGETKKYATLNQAIALEGTNVTLIANTEVAENLTISAPVAGAHTVTVKSGATLDIAAATLNDAGTNKTFADGVNIATEEGATVTLTSGGGYFSITGEGTVQAVGNANFIYGLGSVKNTISANLVIPTEKAFNVRAWNNCAPLGGGNITVNGTITANSGDTGALKLKVASGKTLVASSAIGVPVTFENGAILDAPVTVNAAVSTEGTVTVNNATAGVAFLTYTGDAPAAPAKTFASATPGHYAYVSTFENTHALAFAEVTTPEGTSNEEIATATQAVANALAATTNPNAVVTAITNPGVASVLTGTGVGVALEGTTATFTYTFFGISALKVVDGDVIVTVELGDNLNFADGASVSLVDGNGNDVTATPVDADGNEVQSPTGPIRYFKTSLTTPFKVKAKATK